MGGCQNIILKAMYIHRHDEAMRRLLKAITRGRHGSFLRIADIGRDDLIQGLGVINKRIPDWLLTDSDVELAGLPRDRRHTLRPDIMLIEVSQAEQCAHTANEDDLASPLIPASTIVYPRTSSTDCPKAPANHHQPAAHCPAHVSYGFWKEGTHLTRDTKKNIGKSKNNIAPSLRR